MLAHAQELVYTLKELMPSSYQKDNLEAMLGLFLQAQGHPLPQHCQTKSPSALSRFLNLNPWSTREMIRTVRTHILQTVLKLLSQSGKGRRPFLQVIIDRAIKLYSACVCLLLQESAKRVRKLTEIYNLSFQSIE